MPQSCQLADALYALGRAVLSLTLSGILVAAAVAASADWIERRSPPH